jgi:20S proteasome alpha/beta subunit
MASMIDGESYLGKVLVRSISTTGDVTMYCWPLRCLKSKIGGPTFGVDVKGVEILRFDPHGSRGHWHRGGYDKLGAGGSHVDFPEGLVESANQVSWSLEQVREQAVQLLSDAGYPDEASTVDSEKLRIVTGEIVQHLEGQGDLLSRAIEQDLIAV